MANFTDYFKWRGDIPFSVDPFNEIDNIILSVLAFTDFDGVLSSDINERRPVTEVCADYFSKHNDIEIMAREASTREAPFILRMMRDSRRFQKTELAGFVNSISAEKEKQMSAYTAFLEDGSAYVAFRGTDNTMIGWKEDFNLSFINGTPGQIEAVRYLNENFGAGQDGGSGSGSGSGSANSEIPLRVGGHSKGGHFAVYSSAFCRPEIQDRIMEIYSNDGPGFLDEVTATWGYRRIYTKIRSIVPQGTVFGLLLNSDYPHEIVKSTEHGIYQHDAYSWEVLGNRFVRAAHTDRRSKVSEKTFERWLAGMNPEERSEFVDSLFEMVNDAGMTRMSQILNARTRSGFEMLKAYMRMDEDDQRVLKTAFTELLSSTIGALSEEFHK